MTARKSVKKSGRKSATRSVRKTAKSGRKSAAKKSSPKTASKKTARKSSAKKSGRTAAAKKAGRKAAPTSARKYGKKATRKIGRVMHEFKEGKLKSGKGGAGGKVKSREQAIAIAISEAREEGDKVPKRRTAKK